MKTLLIEKRVITNQQRKIIDDKIGEDQMIYIIADIIIPSLKVNNSKKYNGLLEAMEESDDTDLQAMAKKLSKLIIVSVSGILIHIIMYKPFSFSFSELAICVAHTYRRHGS